MWRVYICSRDAIDGSAQLSNRLHMTYPPFRVRCLILIMYKGICPHVPTSLQTHRPVSTVQISPEFLRSLQAAYQSDPRCTRLLEILQANSELPAADRAKLPFLCAQGILYAKPDALHRRRRPVITKSLHHDIFRNAHDSLGHPGYDRVHEGVSGNFYLFDISKRLKEYLCGRSLSLLQMGCLK
jgi:hypothetical protein